MLVIPRVKVNKLTDLAGDFGLNILLELQERADWLLERCVYGISCDKQWGPCFNQILTNFMSCRLKTETTDMPFLEYKVGFHIVPSLV